MENFAYLVGGFVVGVVVCIAGALASFAGDVSQDLGEKNETEYL